jgi:hypothetical protein
MLGAGGLHVRNGGTSMASPIVAGIAALYLEKCPKATWLDYKNDLLSSAFTNGYMTHTLPDYAYGYGAAHGLNTLLKTNFTPIVVGDTIVCDSAVLGVFPNPISVVWNNGSSAYPLVVDTSGYFSAEVTNTKGCKGHTDSIHITMGNMPVPSTISYTNDTLFASANNNYQWYFNGVVIPGATSLFYVPQHSGNYTVSTTDTSGICSANSTIYIVGITGITSMEEENAVLTVFPNPATNSIAIIGVSEGVATIYDMNGKKVSAFNLQNKARYSIDNLENGTYIIEVNVQQECYSSKFVKQ